jgi:hypothetical protein
MEDLFEDMGGDDNDGGGASDEDATVRDAEGAVLMEEIVNRLDEDDIMFGNPRWLENFGEMKQATLDPLYTGCPKHWTALRFDITMLMLKARHGWSDTSFNDLMHVLADTYPDDNKVPANTNRAKKLIRPVAMKLRKFDACPNHCILYRGEQYEKLMSCPHCGASRYKRNAGCRVDANNEGPMGGSKKKKVAKKEQFSAQLGEEELGYMQRKSPALSIWYLPIIDRLWAIFGNPEDAKLMSWHASSDRTKDDGKLRHPFDGKKWKDFDAMFPELGKEAHNVRFTLSTNGMNSFGDLNSSHSTWSVILTIYNLPPSICQKRRYLLLTMLIFRPKQPGNDIDVFLEPLMEDMKKLWEEGVQMVDASLKKKFTLKAKIFVTITDYPGLFSLSRQIKGKTGCVFCIYCTCYTYHKGSNKMVYMRHRRFLVKKHSYRKDTMIKYFDNQSEPQLDESKRMSYGEKVFGMVKDMDRVEFGKKKRDSGDNNKEEKVG